MDRLRAATALTMRMILCDVFRSVLMDNLTADLMLAQQSVGTQILHCAADTLKCSNVGLATIVLQFIHLPDGKQLAWSCGIINV